MDKQLIRQDKETIKYVLDKYANTKPDTEIKNKDLSLLCRKLKITPQIYKGFCEIVKALILNQFSIYLRDLEDMLNFLEEKENENDLDIHHESLQMYNLVYSGDTVCS